MPDILTMPVEGTVIFHETLVPQKPLSELALLFNDVLDDPSVHSIRWHQYTPYYNDGEACYFGVYELYFKLNNWPPEDEEDEEIGDYGDGYISNKWDYGFLENLGEYSIAAGGVYEITYAVNPELLDAWLLLKKEFGSGAYNAALYSTYGNHAVVTIRPDLNSILVEYFEHD